MYNTIAPLIDLTNNNLLALTQAIFAAPQSDPNKLNDLWRSTMENQARFFSEYTNSVLLQLARNRLLMAEQMERLSTHAEHVTSQMAHAAVRSVAIATQARREKRDRRVFPLPLPGERRYEALTDRRKAMLSIVNNTGVQVSGV